MKKKRSDSNEYCDIFESPIGTLFLVFSSDLLTAVHFQRPAGIQPRSTPQSRAVQKELREFFGQARSSFTCRTEFRTGTEFEHEVWKALTEIPYGETRTYKWVAERIGHPLASRAVGNALSKNPIPIVIPCHRVIESDGSLGGYSAGEDIKRRLLELEYYGRLGRT